jgi:hypothetical protein
VIYLVIGRATISFACDAPFIFLFAIRLRGQAGVGIEYSPSATNGTNFVAHWDYPSHPRAIGVNG